MYGLRCINNHYAGSGDGRDWIVVGHQEFRGGRSKALPYATATLGRPCKRSAHEGRGPKPLTHGALTMMAKGEQRPPHTSLARSASDPSVITKRVARMDRDYERSRLDKLPKSTAISVLVGMEQSGIDPLGKFPLPPSNGLAAPSVNSKPVPAPSMKDL